MGKRAIKTVDGVGIIIAYFAVYVLISNLISLFLTLVFAKNGDISLDIINYVQLPIDIFTMILVCYFGREIVKTGIEDISRAGFYTNILKFYGLFWIFNIIVAIPTTILSNGEVSLNQEAVETLLKLEPAYMTFSVVIFAPIVEELVFRGAIYGLMRKKCGILLSLAASTLSFALMHFVISIIAGDTSDLIFLASYAAPSLVLGLSYEKTRNILTPIIIHTINNLLSTILIFLV